MDRNDENKIRDKGTILGAYCYPGIRDERYAGICRFLHQHCFVFERLVNGDSCQYCQLLQQYGRVSKRLIVIGSC